MTDLISYATGNLSAGTYTPSQLILGGEVLTQNGTVVSGQNLAAGQVVALDSAGKIIAHNPGAVVDADASGDTVNIATTVAKAIGIMASDVDASSGDKAGTYYVSGVFNIAALTWHADSNTELLKKQVFAGTAISVRTVLG